MRLAWCVRTPLHELLFTSSQAVLSLLLGSPRPGCLDFGNTTFPRSHRLRTSEYKRLVEHFHSLFAGTATFTAVLIVFVVNILDTTTLARLLHSISPSYSCSRSSPHFCTAQTTTRVHHQHHLGVTPLTSILPLGSHSLCTPNA